jgi:hypothetical protein
MDISVYSGVADPNSDLFLGLDPDPDPLGTVWIRIRILLSASKNSKKNLNSYCFVTPF